MHNIRLLNFNEIRQRVFLLFFLLFFVHFVWGQNRCGTEPYTKFLKDKGRLTQTETQFENWLKSKPGKIQFQNNRSQAIQYRIQVVVHIIHNDEPIGIGTNIPDEQVRSQINVLNKDFNRLNLDATRTPAEFLPVAGSMKINFVLAERDPTGLISNGINRVKGTKPSWTLADNDQLKALSYWPAENYLNIWVCDLTDYIGYTQFPESSLPGLGNSPINRLTDGIIIQYRAFGSSDEGNFDLLNAYNKGRTTTHEMGHFFGLRHVWGEDIPGCAGTDYVNDTPAQSMETTGCPNQPLVIDCSPDYKMFQNYLDYTDDYCMNIFTQGQIGRMITVLENSPRRNTLLLNNITPPEENVLPKIFSPNADGINDLWTWKNISLYTGCKLIIFNRFGKKVFEMVSYDNSWDGRSSEGQQLEAEAYYYVIQCYGQPDVTGGVRIIR